MHIMCYHHMIYIHICRERERSTKIYISEYLKFSFWNNAKSCISLLSGHSFQAVLAWWFSPWVPYKLTKWVRCETGWKGLEREENIFISCHYIHHGREGETAGYSCNTLRPLVVSWKGAQEFELSSAKKFLFSPRLASTKLIFIPFLHQLLICLAWVCFFPRL